METEKMDVTNEIERLKEQLRQVESERDQYKRAYEQITEQNDNMFGLYSNTIDYVIAQTTRKKSN